MSSPNSSPSRSPSWIQQKVVRPLLKAGAIAALSQTIACTSPEVDKQIIDNIPKTASHVKIKPLGSDSWRGVSYDSIYTMKPGDAMSISLGNSGDSLMGYQQIQVNKTTPLPVHSFDY